MLRLAYITSAVLMSTISVYALDIAIKPTQSPLGNSIGVQLSGPIENGDAEKVWDALRQHNIEQSNLNLHISLSSPGGSVNEGLKLGRLFYTLQTILPIKVSSTVAINGQPTDCASACVLIYLGATYRFLPEKSRLGVHQFSFVDPQNVDSATATSVSQLISAEVTEYLRDTNVDQSFFSIMSKTEAADIHWVNHAMLRELNILNEFIYEEHSEYKNINGYYYLLLSQQSYWGENKIAVACDNGNVEFIAFLQPPNLDEVAEHQHELTVVVDGNEFTPVTYTPPIPTDRFGRSQFKLSHKQLMSFASAKSVGARMKTPNAPIFFGFETNIRDSKLRDTIKGCLLR